MSIRSPTWKLVLMPPAALVTIRDVTPSCFITRTGKDNVGQGVTLIEMETALHADDGFPPKRPATNWPLVARGGGADKVGNFAVGDDVLVLDHLGNAAQAGAQNQTDAGRFPNARTDIFRGFLYVIAILRWFLLTVR